MFSGIWAKVTGFLSLMVAGLLMFVGYQSKEIKRQNRELELKGKKEDIREKIEQDEKEIYEDATDKKNSINTDDWAGRI